MQKRYKWVLVSTIIAMYSGACTDDKSDSNVQEVVSTTDLTENKDTGSPPASERVTIDMSSHVNGPAGAYVRKITDSSDLLSGDAAQGRLGDWVIGNKRTRFIIQGKDRHSSPCPYGGNVIDAALKSANGFNNDVMGEACVFLQLGRTLLPEHFEIIADGSKGPAILAVTGDDTLLDFLNIGSLVKSYVGDLVSLPVDPEKDLEITITNYFILDGNSNALKQVTAFRNNGDSTLYTLFGDLVDSGGTIEFFNPASQKKGFGYKDFTPEVMDFLAFRGATSSYAYVPETKENGAPNASYLAISGVAGIAVGNDSIITALTQSSDDLKKSASTLVTEPGQSSSVLRTIVVGDGSLSTLTNTVFQLRGLKTGSAEIVVKTNEGEAVPGRRVSLGTKGAVTQGVTDAEGRFTAELPEGTYNVMTDRAENRVLEETQISITAGKTTVSNVTVELQGYLNLTVVDALGKPTAAKVTVMCSEDCLEPATSQHRDVTFDKLPTGVQAVSFLNVDGQSQIPLPSGEFRVVVTRGPLWSVWPDNQLSGKAIQIAPGKTTELNAVLQKVVPTPGWMSADLHVHAINSPDSPIDNATRVRSMLAEGVDILVSTDHDYITDFAPSVKALGAGDEIATVVGEELTTFDYGHFNVFPVTVDNEDLLGGAIDWGKGKESNMHPSELFQSMKAFEGEQVIQVNHPVGGYFSMIKLDVTTGHTQAPPEQFRIAPSEPDPETGDTGMFSENWTAVELLNGLNGSRFYGTAGYWFTLLNRGLVRTGTAVSDTHRKISTQSGGSRTYVYMGENNDTPITFDEERFAKQLNAGHATGSNGPFIEFFAEQDSDVKVATGETLNLSKSGNVNFLARISMPLWMNISRVELVGNVTGVAPKPGSMEAAQFEPLQTIDVVLDKNHIVDDQRYEVTVTFPQEVKEDGWYIILVHGTATAEKNMFPVVPSTSVKPFAFSNPILVNIGDDEWKPRPSADSHNTEPQKQTSHPAAMSTTRVINPTELHNLLKHLSHIRNCDN